MNLSQRNRMVVNEHYSMDPNRRIQRATFNKPFSHKTTGNMGMLIPILCQEVLPGDMTQIGCEIFMRPADFLTPLMDNATVETQGFFIPMRVVWPNSLKMWGEQDNPGDSIAYTVPQIELQASDLDEECDIWDYMGMPRGSQLTHNLSVSALPFRCYNWIWNAWYRDQNLQSRMQQTTGDSGDVPNHFSIRRRNKKHDYFRAALPSPQRGAAVTVPLGQKAYISGLGVQNLVSTGGPGNWYDAANGISAQTYPLYTDDASSGTNKIAIRQNDNGSPDVWADISSASAITINTLRLAIQTQKVLELDARAGTRYAEQLPARWGVKAQDARLQRPEYIGGGSTLMRTSAIAQTSATNVEGSDTALGSLAGQATFSGNHRFTAIGHEHGFIMILMSVMTRQSYQYGLDRMYTRKTRFDHATPELTGIGEQAIREDEIWVTGVAATDALAFGYIPRYDEYRFSLNRITGKFRSNATGTLDFWHLAQKYVSAPTLSETFIQENAPWQRAFSGGENEQDIEFKCDIEFFVRSTRPLPAYGIPGGGAGPF